MIAWSGSICSSKKWLNYQDRYCFFFGGGSYRKKKEKEIGLKGDRLGFICEFQMALESSSICSDSYDEVNGQHRIPKTIAEGR